MLVFIRPGKFCRTLRKVSLSMESETPFVWGLVAMGFFKYLPYTGVLRLNSSGEDTLAAPIAAFGKAIRSLAITVYWEHRVDT